MKSPSKLLAKIWNDIGTQVEQGKIHFLFLSYIYKGWFHYQWQKCESAWVHLLFVYLDMACKLWSSFIQIFWTFKLSALLEICIVTAGSVLFVFARTQRDFRWIAICNVFIVTFYFELLPFILN